MYCSALTTGSLPASLATIGINPFASCTSLTNITVASGNPTYKHSDDKKMLLSKDGKTLIAYPSAAGEVSLPGITAIGDSAFQNCTALTTGSLPAATSIGNTAFANTGTGNLTVTLGSTVPALGKVMFGGGAKSVTVRVPSGATVWDSIVSDSPYSGNDTTVNWGNGFRGGGWTAESAFVDGGADYVNNKITLTIEEE